MDEMVIRTLGLIGSRFSPEVLSRFLVLLPAESLAPIGAFARQVGGGIDLELAPVEQRLLAPLEPPQESAPEEIGKEIEGEIPESESEPREPLLPVLLALLSAASEPDKVAQFLVHLPLLLQAQIVLKIAAGDPQQSRLELASEEVERFERIRAELPAPERWGVEAACRILRAIPDSERLRSLLSAIDRLDREAVLRLQLHLFVFEDLLLLPDPELQNLLAQIDNATLGQALLMTRDSLRNRLLSNISARRRAIVEEEEERQAGSTFTEIEAAQLRVLGIARRLYEQGRISTYLGSVEAPEAKSVPISEEVPHLKEEEKKSETGAAPEWRGYLKLAGVGVLLLVAAGIVWKGKESPLFLTFERKLETPDFPEKPLKVMVQSKGTLASAESLLDSSGGLKTPEGVQAVLEFPHRALVEMEELTEVEQPQKEEEAGSRTLYLRVGQARATVLEDGFEIRTPAVQIFGAPGAVFHARVVLDASTLVEVFQGSVQIVSQVESDLRWELREGEEGRFDIRGGSAIRKKDR